MTPCARRKRRRNDDRPACGFSLIETVVALAVIAALAALVTPMVIELLSTTRGNNTTSEVKTLYEAVLGDQTTTFGYVGDVGAYPTSLLDLVRVPSGSPAGWRGPYVSATPSPISTELVDQFGNSYELFVKIAATSAADALAIISRGPDGLSTNTAATPNTASDFSGSPNGPPAPTDNAYLTTLVSGAAVNQDNIVFPALDSTNNSTLVQSVILGTFVPTIMNFDSNTAVNTTVSACPGLYTVNQRSVPRATTLSDTYTPGFGIELVQGFWQLSVTTPLTTDPVYSTTATVLPNSTLSPDITFSSLNSANTSSFNLTVANKWASTVINVYASGTFVNLVSFNTTSTLSIKGCAPVQFRTGANLFVDSFIMPYLNYTRITGTSQRQLTVGNNGVSPKLKIIDNGLTVATVRAGSTITITVNEQDSITITDNSNATISGTPFTMPASNTSKTCTASACS